MIINKDAMKSKKSKHLKLHTLNNIKLSFQYCSLFPHNSRWLQVPWLQCALRGNARSWPDGPSIRHCFFPRRVCIVVWRRPFWEGPHGQDAAFQSQQMVKAYGSSDWFILDLLEPANDEGWGFFWNSERFISGLSEPPNDEGWRGNTRPFRCIGWWWLRAFLNGSSQVFRGHQIIEAESLSEKFISGLSEPADGEGWEPFCIVPHRLFGPATARFFARRQQLGVPYPAVRRHSSIVWQVWSNYRAEVEKVVFFVPFPTRGSPKEVAGSHAARDRLCRHGMPLAGFEQPPKLFSRSL